MLAKHTVKPHYGIIIDIMDIKAIKNFIDAWRSS